MDAEAEVEGAVDSVEEEEVAEVERLVVSLGVVEDFSVRQRRVGIVAVDAVARCR